MPDLKKLLRLGKKDYFEVHLTLINCLLPQKMTPKEIEIVSAFMSLEGSITEYRFGVSAKKIIKRDLTLSDAGLSNHLKSLLTKGFLINKDNTISIWPILIPDFNEQTYMFKLVNLDSNHS